ncbi:helix-turn-helix transcriptional regulator [uncultured Algimonas sp.]|uniref:helix-turn-helix transcriptional regulator n=1 Tax=uncultured Algimonas sp. TaxID=1547920 RepID=UPI002611B293|nr:helix-turn-helix transcriptional regulator [uncultured Algimonas sp.]
MVEELNNRIRHFRKASNLTQAQLAERMRVSRKTVNTVENGVFAPSVIVALKFAQALGTSVEHLFELTSPVG